MTGFAKYAFFIFKGQTWCMYCIVHHIRVRGHVFGAWLTLAWSRGQPCCFIVRQVSSSSAMSQRSLRPLLYLVLVCGTISHALAANSGDDDDDTCFQGFASAKRTLQATHRQAPRTVMSASEQVTAPDVPVDLTCISFDVLEKERLTFIAPMS